MSGSLIPTDQPPESFNDEQKEWLNRMFKQARLSDQNSDILTPLTAIPDRPIVNKLYWFTEAIPASDIAYEGVYIYKSDGRWWALADLPCGTAWEDNLSKLSAAKASGGGGPLTTMAVNGSAYDQVPVLNGSPAVKLINEFHVKHDSAEGKDYYPHIHFTNDLALPAGDVFQFTFSYQQAAGHQQAQFPAAANNVISFTVPAGGLPAWTHCIAEASTGIAAPEVDSIILATLQQTSHTGTYAGNIGGLFVDLHYLRDRVATVSKAPDFYT